MKEQPKVVPQKKKSHKGAAINTAKQKQIRQPVVPTVVPPKKKSL